MTGSTTAKRPYLLRAYYDWLLDNDLTPYLVVDAFYPHTVVPDDFVKDGQIVLNISPNACGNLQLGNDKIVFNARFKGIPRDIIVPMGAALAIYARENGDGVMFELEETYEREVERSLGDLVEQPASFVEIVDKPQTIKTATSDKPKAKRSASHLKILK
ncbi:ClpXP protease specificity-enhancing factor [Testudinibacter sp. TR-2022]|uniref:ClpXP protease specificity-enhancing factor n=1 Tax=Testudinibacter sp. TR-2022 TaxID=2585029 RepID=UPI0011191943|nr:ClpXP protease specificity-enhancing factor [Testudinibacter sp. TR-2022]TNH05263.1 ClpXP protease specificity-enhancing factor [Pasteurellaceae bacterium Phil31]TNH06026.1 ClpXP protease specificity-enhancing factor [Testudinibacter sp. TR-2022]TNH07728.1 ClpXP protease specificity-enhancing factor [Testudinibacter sp. TR-2022]TNH14004.1 ClpXP protease specificity-enhancing factor [Testudinibacter sp. TR-2022]TNH20890.1 ClpXP protease specificity-enhancing factor [Testudinibacter sp. TR-20